MKLNRITFFLIISLMIMPVFADRFDEDDDESTFFRFLVINNTAILDNLENYDRDEQLTNDVNLNRYLSFSANYSFVLDVLEYGENIDAGRSIFEGGGLMNITPNSADVEIGFFVGNYGFTTVKLINLIFLHFDSIIIDSEYFEIPSNSTWTLLDSFHDRNIVLTRSNDDFQNCTMVGGNYLYTTFNIEYDFLSLYQSIVDRNLITTNNMLFQSTLFGILILLTFMRKKVRS